MLNIKKTSVSNLTMKNQLIGAEFTEQEIIQGVIKKERNGIPGKASGEDRI